MDQHPDIALVAECVDARISLLQNEIQVHCLFVLANHGAADTVLVGFPEDFAGDTGPRPFSSFASTVDGQEVECRRVQTRGGPLEEPLEFWWVKSVPFEAGQTRIIRDSYSAPGGSSVGDSEGPHAYFEYTLRTGASWAGVIEAGTITVSVDPCDARWLPASFLPEPDIVDGCRYVWHLRDFEPGTSGPGFIQVSWHDMSLPSWGRTEVPQGR